MTRLVDKIHFGSSLAGVADFSTVDGRCLRLNHSLESGVTITYELSRLPAKSNDFPIDAVECRIWLADSDGCIWTAEACFTADFFVDELAFVFFENIRDCYFWDEAPARLQGLFSTSAILDGVQFSSDDRFYRSFRLRGEWVQAIFKYSWLVFDVAVEQSLRESPRLWARLRQGGAYDPGQSLTDIHTTDELPGLIFELQSSPWRMLYANGAMITANGSWMMSPVPKALVFERTEEKGAPQAGVAVIDSIESISGVRQLESIPEPPPMINPFTGKPISKK
jgi:hypothetical protein